MKAKELLKTIIYNVMPTEMMGIVWTPVCPNNETQRVEIWAEWYKMWFDSSEVCILSENKEYLYIVSSPRNYDLYDGIDGACWVLNDFGHRVYLIEIE